MFPYDPALLAAVQKPSQSIPDVLQIMQAIDAICVAGDGLKWFNWLYLQVTQAVETREAAGGFSNPAWLANLDVQFAQLYFNAVTSAISGQPMPGCWEALFAVRNQTRLARIQFALAGINAHINHDLPLALVSTGKAFAIEPRHGSTQYTDYTSLNSTLESLIEAARAALHVRLLGDALPPVTNLEDLMAGWSVTAAREGAWNNAELLWRLEPEFSGGLMDTIDGLTAVVSKALLVAVP